MPPTPASVDLSHFMVSSLPGLIQVGTGKLGTEGGELSWVDRSTLDQVPIWPKPSRACTL